MIDLDVHLALIVAGDATAFARWLAGAEYTVRVSLASFAAVVDVEAVLQESLLRVWQVAPRFVADGEPNGLLRLAIRIGRNLCVSELRRTKTRPVEPRARGRTRVSYLQHRDRATPGDNAARRSRLVATRRPLLR